MLLNAITNWMSFFVATSIFGPPIKIKKSRFVYYKNLARNIFPQALAQILCSGFLMGSIIVNNLELSLESRITIFGFLYPIGKFIYKLIQ